MNQDSAIEVGRTLEQERELRTLVAHLRVNTEVFASLIEGGSQGLEEVDDLLEEVRGGRSRRTIEEGSSSTSAPSSPTLSRHGDSSSSDSDADESFVNATSRFTDHYSRALRALSEPFGSKFHALRAAVNHDPDLESGPQDDLVINGPHTERSLLVPPDARQVPASEFLTYFNQALNTLNSTFNSALIQVRPLERAGMRLGIESSLGGVGVIATATNLYPLFQIVKKWEGFRQSSGRLVIPGLGALKPLVDSVTAVLSILASRQLVSGLTPSMTGAVASGVSAVSAGLRYRELSRLRADDPKARYRRHEQGTLITTILGQSATFIGHNLSIACYLGLSSALDGLCDQEEHEGDAEIGYSAVSIVSYLGVFLNLTALLLFLCLLLRMKCCRS